MAGPREKNKRITIEKGVFIPMTWYEIPIDRAQSRSTFDYLLRTKYAKLWDEHVYSQVIIADLVSRRILSDEMA